MTIKWQLQIGKTGSDSHEDFFAMDSVHEKKIYIKIGLKWGNKKNKLAPYVCLHILVKFAYLSGHFFEKWQPL